METSASTQPSILIVDDSEQNRKIFSLMLKRLGYKAQFAENGQCALDKVQQQNYDLIFMDCEMPIIDGYTATQRIRQQEQQQNQSRTIIIALSAYSLPEHREASLAAGMDDHVNKPLRLETLKAVLAQWLEKSSVLHNEKNHSPMTVSVLDTSIIEDLRKQLGDDVEFILHQFLDYMSHQLQAIQAATLEKDSESIRHIVHQFKGESLQIGATSLGEICKNIETFAKRQQIDAISATIPQLKTAIEHVHSAILAQHFSS